jgi:type I restriction enzyme S subunit
VVRIRDVLAGKSDTFSEEVHGDKYAKYAVRNGDILVGMDGDFHMGFWAGGNASLVQRVARFQPKGEISRLHLFHGIKQPIEHFNATITGTTVAHLGHKHIKTIHIVWPEKELLVKAAAFFDLTLDAILNLRLRNETLRQTRDLILPKLISGELDVSKLAIDLGEAA